MNEGEIKDHQAFLEQIEVGVRLIVRRGLISEPLEPRLIEIMED